MVYVLLAEGFEEVEALTPVDLLRRAGVETRLVGVTGETVCGARGIRVVTDLSMDDIDLAQADMIVLPGGMPGTLNEEASPVVQAAIDYCVKNDRYVSAICAAPSILGKKGLLEGKTAVCYPGFETALTGAAIGSEGVVQDGKFITARGAGVAVDFGLRLIQVLCGEKTAAEIRASIICD